MVCRVKTEVMEQEELGANNIILQCKRVRGSLHLPIQIKLKIIC